MLTYDEWCEVEHRNPDVLPGSSWANRNMRDYIKYVQDIITGNRQDNEGRVRCLNVLLAETVNQGTLLVEDFHALLNNQDRS
jgi:hypothetical protein